MFQLIFTFCIFYLDQSHWSLNFAEICSVKFTEVGFAYNVIMNYELRRTKVL